MLSFHMKYSHVQLHKYDMVNQGCQKEAAAVLRGFLGVYATPTSLD